MRKNGTGLADEKEKANEWPLVAMKRTAIHLQPAHRPSTLNDCK